MLLAEFVSKTLRMRVFDPAADEFTRRVDHSNIVAELKRTAKRNNEDRKGKSKVHSTLNVNI